MRAAAALALVLAACGSNPYEAKVDGVVLAEADGVVVPEEGPLVKVTLERDHYDPQIPEGAPVVRLAINYDVSWKQARTVIQRVVDAGAKPVLLVGQRNRVRGFVLSDEIGPKHIRLTAGSDGKFCVGPPTSNEARCTQSADRKHIPKAFVREEVRDSVKLYEMTDVDVVVTEDMDWADVVRTIDGARTCCDGMAIRAQLADNVVAPPAE